MGKFETYPEATTLENSDITLYNKSSITHKVTFGRLVSLIKNKIAESGLITSINTGAGLTGGVITTSGTIKCKLKTETLSSLASSAVSTMADRQYPVNLDKDGNLSVNVPWSGSTYLGEKGVTVAGNKISASLKSNVPSALSSANMGSTADRQYAVGLDVDGKLSVNIPWTEGGMTINGSNADSHVNFAGAFTVGNRKSGSTIGTNSTAEGYNTIASGNYSHAEGYYSQAKYYASHAEGNNTKANNNCTHAEGNDTKANGVDSHAEGQYTEANGEASHAEGRYTEANGNYSSVKGYGDSGLYYYSDISELDTTVNHSISANGIGSSAEGYTEYDENEQFELRSQSIIQANGLGSHAEGCAIVDLQAESDSMIIAYGDGSHAEGYSDGKSIILASGKGSHAEGRNTTASGNYSHAEGSNTKASGINSHAEGEKTKATAYDSHAEGEQTTASGYGSHAEGRDTTASGSYSHAEGQATTASGDYSHASGYGAVAPLISQFVHGGCNKKFGESSTDYRGVFGFQPDGRYYTTDTTIAKAYNGSGGTASANVTLKLSLKQCAIYTLYVSTYHTDNTCNISMFTIATPKTTTNTSMPSVETLLLHDVTVQGVENSKIEISSAYDYMFHLIRIM
ncbi:MAG: hypothetical protein ACLRFE_01285 [Clostridia bacterium]